MQEGQRTYLVFIWILNAIYAAIRVSWWWGWGGGVDCWKSKQESLDWQRRVCDEAKWEMKQKKRKKKKKGNAESPWPPACNLQSADGEARDEEVHSIHF